MTCIYCALLNSGDLRECTINENEDYVACLDAYPIALLHTLIITKNHYPTVNDVPDLDSYIRYAFLVARHIATVTSCGQVDVVLSGGSVPHAHIHLLPNISGPWAEHKNTLRQHQKVLRESKYNVPSEHDELLHKLKF